VDAPVTPILTFGYGSRDIDDAIDMLCAEGVEFVIDVRSSPWSRFRPEWSQDALSRSLRSKGLVYVYMGDELGGRPDHPDCYDDEGHVDYLRCRRRPEYRRGLDRLISASRQGLRVALMCSEGRPEDCHRTKLVGESLVECGVRVEHLDQAGKRCVHEEVILRITGGQLSLVDEPHALLNRSRGRYQPAS
jgi:uncharacterized protein (DUF488 family)